MLRRALSGSATVGEAFWGVLLGGSVLLSIAISLFLFFVALPLRSEALVAVGWLVQSTYIVFGSVCLWRCSPNAKSNAGRLTARAFAVVYGVGQVAFVIMLFADGFSAELISAVGAYS